jgi:hypothetical protein
MNTNIQSLILSAISDKLVYTNAMDCAHIYHCLYSAGAFGQVLQSQESVAMCSNQVAQAPVEVKTPDDKKLNLDLGKYFEGYDTLPAKEQKNYLIGEIKKLNGKPPQRGAVSKFEEVLDLLVANDSVVGEEVVTEDTPAPEAEVNPSPDDDVRVDVEFGDVMDECQEIFDELQSKNILDDMSIIFTMTQELDSSVESPDELSLENLVKLRDQLKAKLS